MANIELRLQFGEQEDPLAGELTLVSTGETLGASGFLALNSCSPPSDREDINDKLLITLNATS